MLGTAALTQAAALLQPLALARSTRLRLHERPWMLDALKEHIAARAGIHPRKVDILLRAGQETISLDTLVGDDENTPLSSLIDDKTATDPEDELLREFAALDDTGGMEQVAYIRADAQDLPFRDQSFDAVCCFAALHLFADPMKALDSIARVLTPGGRVAIFTSCRGRSAPMRTWESLMASQSGMRMFEREEVVEALEDRGFTQIRQRVSGVTQFVGGRLDG